MSEDSSQTSSPRPDATTELGAGKTAHGDAPGAGHDATSDAPPPLAPQDLRPEHFPTTARNDGRIAWIVAFVMCIPVPVLSVIAGYITMIVVGRGQRGKNPVARAKGRRASNFAIISLASLLLFVLGSTIFVTLEEFAGVDPGSHPLFMAIIPFGMWGLFIGPFTAFVIAIIAATDHVSERQAEKIYSRAGW